jgi:hypothetical protein
MNSPAWTARVHTGFVEDAVERDAFFRTHALGRQHAAIAREGIGDLGDGRGQGDQQKEDTGDETTHAALGYRARARISAPGAG